jgi:hypothetical protein
MQAAEVMKRKAGKEGRRAITDDRERERERERERDLPVPRRYEQQH